MSLSEFDILKSSHQFIRETTTDNNWNDQLAEKYYSSLYREFAICDLKHYKSGNVRLSLPLLTISTNTHTVRSQMAYRIRSIIRYRSINLRQHPLSSPIFQKHPSHHSRTTFHLHRTFSIKICPSQSRPMP